MLKTQGFYKKLQTTWKKSENKARKMNYYLLYTIAFIIVSLVVYSFFYLNHKSFIIQWDGLTQHYNSLEYYGKWLRSIVRSLLFDHKLEVPMWDLSIGYGSDVITTLHYYVIGDPLDLFAVLVPVRYTEYLYNSLILIRVYLLGLSFSYYSRTHKNKKIATLTGALAYCFCGYVLTAAVRHPYFVNPMIYFPLILVGADRILEKKKPALFMGMLAISCISNFYFAYMICLLTVIYVVVRYLTMLEKFQWKEAIKMFFKFVIFALVGISMAGIIMIPMVHLLMNTQRMSASNNIELFYPITYYLKVFGGFATNNTGYWTCLSLTTLSVTAVIALFIKKNKNIQLKIGFIVLTVLLMVPYFGHVMNGFSYVSNRWLWGYAALTSYIIVKMVPELEKMTECEKIKVLVWSILYVLLSMLNHISRTEQNMLNGVFLMIFGIVLLFSTHRKEMNRYIKYIALGMTCISIFINAFYSYSLQKGNYIRDFIESGEAHDKLTSNLPTDMLKEINDKTIARYDQLSAKKLDNTAMSNHLYGTGFYFSLNNGHISEYLDEMYINEALEDIYGGLDGRRILQSLASVKYFITQSNLSQLVPYGFEKKAIATIELENVAMTDKETGLPFASDENLKEGMATVASTKYSLYRAKNTLSMGYTYDTYIKRDVYEKLSVTDKQEALLQGVVLEDSTFDTTDLVLDNKIIEYSMEADRDIISEDHAIQVNSQGVTITLNFEGLTNSENYVIFDGLRYEPIHPLSIINKDVWNTMTDYEQKKQKLSYRDWNSSANNAGMLDITGNGVTKSLTTYNSDYNFYSGKENYLVNLGYSKNGVTQVTIKFNKTGRYVFDKISVACQPFGKVNKNLNKLRKNELTQVRSSTNSISGTITCDKDKILCMSIPYSEGWTAYVDGEKTQVKQANTMFTAVELSEGEHTVEFRYRTPRLLIGAVISGVGCVLYMIISLFYLKKKK